MKTITTEELNKKVESGSVALFDVRGDLEYEQRHIPGARTAPLGGLAYRIAGVMKPDSEIILYSNGGDCTLAKQAVERLESLRMTNVYLYEEGLSGWVAAGHPAVESTHAKINARGPVRECRSVLVDRENAYGGAFRGEPSGVMSAGG